MLEKFATRAVDSMWEANTFVVDSIVEILHIRDGADIKINLKIPLVAACIGAKLVQRDLRSNDPNRCLTMLPVMTKKKHSIFISDKFVKKHRGLTKILEHFIKLQQFARIKHQSEFEKFRLEWSAKPEKGIKPIAAEPIAIVASSDLLSEDAGVFKICAFIEFIREIRSPP